MCGITGIYAFNQVGRINMINLSRATQHIVHRGPDNFQLYNDEFIGFGHTRLSIIDTSEAGNQPISDEEGRFMIIYNGEVYNYKELRKSLQDEGVRFRSETDTEVVLQLYRRKGKECLQELNGFFAFAIFDHHNHELFIARDRFGIKPLYYQFDDDKLMFSSELSSLAAFGVEKKVDPVALYLYLQLNYVPHPYSMIRGVKKLAPGHYISVKQNQVTVQKYYDLTAHGDSPGYSSSKEQLQTLLSDSVKMRLHADVPLGSFLSGGVDSSVIAALAKEQHPGLKTFSVRFKESGFLDESSYARRVARHLGTEHIEIPVSKNDIHEQIFQAMDSFDEPFADSSALAVYMLSRKVREHVKVALSGDGADELFGGYNKHYATWRMMNPGRTESIIRSMQGLWNVLPQNRSSFLFDRFRRLSKFAETMDLSGPHRYWRLAGFASDEESAHVMESLMIDSLDFEEYFDYREDLLKEVTEEESVNSILRTDMALVLPGDMLKKVDLMSMANGLEVRVPFLDHRIVEFVNNLPGEYKIDGKSRKKILRDAFRERLPNFVFSRPKKGFEVPLLNWLRKDMRSLINDDLLADNFVQEQGVFNLDEVRKLKKKLFSYNPGDTHARIWGLLVFQWWWKKNLA